MFSHVITAAICGIESRKVIVEADVSDGLPMFSMVGFLASEVKESEYRVRTAMKNAGITIAPCRITVNLSPSDLRKAGSWFDLPIAVAVMRSLGHIMEPIPEDTFFAGELSLSGDINPVKGILAMLTGAKQFGCKRCIIPKDNLTEGSMVEGMEVLGASTLREVQEFVNGKAELARQRSDFDQIRLRQEEQYVLDFSDVKGQDNLRRASQIAVAGFHNMLIIGPPGSGKTMTAKRIPSILPRATKDEIFEISRIHSIAGTLPQPDGIMTLRPFRAPHHTVTKAAMAGGGIIPLPGEVSLAHRGILYLDELPEFREETLEVLRQPLEEGKIRIARLNGSYEFPAQFMLIASMNPCKCGYFPDRNRCRCSIRDVKRYLEHVSQPLLDRIDLCVEAYESSFEKLSDKSVGESSASLREKVEHARERQRLRYEGTQYRYNADLDSNAVDRFCHLAEKERKLMERSFQKLKLTGRSYQRILKVARTIADVDGAENIEVPHLAEAISLRTLDQKYWGNLL